MAAIATNPLKITFARQLAASNGLADRGYGLVAFELAGEPLLQVHRGREAIDLTGKDITGAVRALRCWAAGAPTEAPFISGDAPMVIPLRDRDALCDVLLAVAQDAGLAV